jgi:hypothetical protein
VSRTKVVAGSGRGKEGGRQAGRQVGSNMQAERKGVVDREEETSRQRQCGRKKHAVI